MENIQILLNSAMLGVIISTGFQFLKKYIKEEYRSLVILLVCGIVGIAYFFISKNTMLVESILTILSSVAITYNFVIKTIKTIK